MSRGKIVSFRVADEHYAQLVTRSAKGGSPGAFARELMLQALHAERVVDGIQSRLDRQQEQVLELRTDLHVTLRAALIAFGRMEPERAKEWVSRTLKG